MLLEVATAAADPAAAAGSALGAFVAQLAGAGPVGALLAAVAGFQVLGLVKDTRASKGIDALADLAAQVEAATSQASGTVETVAEAGASTVIGTVVINAQRKEAAEIRREFENLIKGKKQRKGGKR